MLSLEQIQEKFPEAFSAERGNGMCYVVNCWKWHKHGGISQMEISPQGVFFCHNCGHRGTLYREFPEHFDDLSEMFPWVEVKRGAISTAAPQRNRNFTGGIMWTSVLRAPGETVPLSSLDRGHPVIEYLAGRGFDIEELVGFNLTNDTRGLFYCTRGQIRMQEDMGTLTGRLVFPVYMEENAAGGGVELVLSGWQARYIDRVLWETENDGLKETWTGFSWRKFKKMNGIWEDKFVAKYYTSPGRRKTTMLGGIPHAKGSDFVAVVEGPLDRYRTGRHSVFTFGKDISNEQIRLLQTYWREAVLLLDPEVDTTTKRFQETIAKMHPLKVHYFKLADNKDPGATPRASTWQQIADHVGNPLLTQYEQQ